MLFRSIVVTRLDGSVLLRVDPQDTNADPILRLAPGTDSAELPIVIEQSGRCDAHALAESKKTYILPVEVSLDGERAIAYDLIIPVALRGRFGDMINQSCGVG